MKIIKKIAAVILIQAFLLMEVAWAGSIYNRPDEVVSYLSPRISINARQFQEVFNQQLLADNHALKQSAELAKPVNNQIPERNKRFIMNIINEWMNSQELADLGAALFAFGSARFRPEHPFFKEAVQFAKRVALNSFAIITGGGPGIMMAANSGAFGISKSVGLSIKLPSEEKSNPNLDIELIFNYFFIRKLVFILYSRGGAVFPGGYGTLEEIFEVLAFNRRNSHAKRPMVLVNKDFYGGFMKVLDNWAKAGIIDKLDDEIFTLRHTEKEAFEHLARLWTDKPQPVKVNIMNFVHALFRASRRLYRIEPSVAIIGGNRIEPESEFGKMALDLATYFTGEGISVIRRGNEGVAASIARAYQKQGESEQGRGLYICLDEGELQANNEKADKTIYFQYNSALKVAMLKHSMGFIIFPGGIDTLDMLFEILCLIQTRKIKPVPIVLVGKEWQELFDWIEKEMVSQKTIKKEDLSLFKIVDTKEEAQEIILKAYQDIKADYPIGESGVNSIPYWKNLNEILLTIDNELGLKQDEIGNLYAVCDVWAEKAKERLGVLGFIEFAEILHVGFHWFLIVKFKNDEQLYAFDRTIGQFLTQGEGVLKQQIVMMSNFIELADIKDFVEVNQNGFYGKAIEHPLARYIFNDDYTQRDDDLSYLAPLLKRYQFYTQHDLDAVSEKEEIITAIIRILQYNNISLSKDRKLSFYFVSNDTGQTLTFDAFKNPRQFKSGGKVYVFGQDTIPTTLSKTIENMKESFKQTVLPQQGVVLSMRKDESYAFEKLTDFPGELMDSVFLSSEEIIGKISPYLKQVFEILKRYKSEGIITRYYLMGGFLRGLLKKGKDEDIDISVIFRRYYDPDLIRGLKEQIQEISKKAGYRIHLTILARGYEYEIEEGKIVHTGLVRLERSLSTFPNPQEINLLRVDNLEIPFSPEGFFLKLIRMCREFNFTENNLKMINGEDVKNNSNNNGIYEEDLMSNDPEIRLKAAIVLKQKGRDNPNLAEVFRNSAVNKNLTLDERRKAAQYLSASEKKEFSYELRPDEEQAARIDKGENDDFEELTLDPVSQELTAEIIRGISGIGARVADALIDRMQQVNWHGQEFEKTMQGIKYFNGQWKEQLKNRLYSEYDMHFEMLDMLIERDVPTEILFSPIEYLFAALVAQETIDKLRQDNAVILEGDRDWFLLEAFQLVQKNIGDLSFNEADKIKHTLKNKWQDSTAISRTIDIFKGLKKLGLYTRRYDSDVETEAILGSASQFIARAYNDSGGAEFAPGPCYDKRGVSVGIESNCNQEHDSIHINLGLSWASKYIWAAHLAMYDYMQKETFNPGRFDYYYNQLVRKENKFNGIDRRTSYIGVWVKDIKDLDMILEIFIPFSIVLTNYMEQDNIRLAKIFRDFRLGMEDIIRNQYDLALNQEFFEQARMVRFVELVSANNRDNNFYKALKQLIEDTQKKIDKELSSSNLDTHSSNPLIPLSRNLQPLPIYQLVGASI